MRKWHRWLSVFFALFMIWIATTGLLGHLAALWPADASAAAAASAAPPPGFECPDGWRCMPPRDESGIKGMTGLFHHLHSGDSFGPVGIAISILSGFCLLFFSISGIWMYVRMWARRPKDVRSLFWD